MTTPRLRFAGEPLQANNEFLLAGEDITNNRMNVRLIDCAKAYAEEQEKST